MITFTEHAGSLAASVTLAITARANKMRAEGVDMAPFAAGEPDFDTPDHVKAAAIKALHDGMTKYAPAPGIAPLREAVAAKFRGNGFEGLDAAGTLVSTGAKGILFLALQVLVGEGDEVIVPTPAWLSYPKMIQAAGGTTVFVETSSEDGYHIDPDKVRAAITPRTKAIILNSPGNPTGAIQPDAVQAEIGTIAAEHGIVVIADEIYEHLVYEPATFRSFAELAPDARDVTLLVNGVSKAYAMTGWRLGYCGGPKEIIQRMTRLQSHATSGVPAFCQMGAVAALEGPTDQLEMMRKTFAGRRDVIMDALGKIDGMVLRQPEGAFYVFPNVEAYFGKRHGDTVVENAHVLAEMLIEHAHAAVVPGTVFEAPEAIRFSYACSDDHIRNGCARVKTFLDGLV